MTGPSPRVLIVIPCLNEEQHIGPLLSWLLPVAVRLDALVVVADGGSTDETRSIAASAAADDERVVLLENPKRLQSAAINLAVERFANGAEYLIRIDAHGGYPPDFCDRLIEDADAVDADSVVVSMETSGDGTVQRANAAAQNSRLGTGGSKHRHAAQGQWIDHGHHALMRISAFRAVGGYDETFSHNEDAELDHRLRAAGFRIWLTGATRMTYYPRVTWTSLFRQYFAYGRGRARNVLKHRVVPGARQLAPLLVFPAALFSAFTFIHWIALVPIAAWAGICLAYGLATALRERTPQLALMGVSIMVMHLAWSAGFWRELIAGHAVRRITS
ncbi:glycosyltransferase family 2 protein [Aliihoeflea sp. PC F10.4]